MCLEGDCWEFKRPTALLASYPPFNLKQSWLSSKPQWSSCLSLQVSGPSAQATLPGFLGAGDPN